MVNNDTEVRTLSLAPRNPPPGRAEASSLH